VVAVSQAPSPESNPDSPLPVVTMVSTLTYHRQLIGQKLKVTVATARVLAIRYSYLESTLYIRAKRIAARLFADQSRSNKSVRSTSPPKKGWYPGVRACISSRITTVIHHSTYATINYNRFNEPFAVSAQQRGMDLDSHGLIFETSVSLLAGSTRYEKFRYSHSTQ
jgi:hypothetical protein